MNPEAYLEMEKLEKTHWWYGGRRKIIQEQISLLGLSENSSILEIGCGTGGNLEMLSSYGHLTAIEMNDYARQVAINNKENSAKILPGSAPDNLPLFSFKFDLICILDVLEHIQDDLSTLVILEKMLADDGKIILTVPAYQWLWSKHDEHHHHYRRYSKKSLREIAKKSHLLIKKTSYFNTFLFPIAASVRLFNNAINKKYSMQPSLPPYLVNKILRIIFSSESKLLKRLNFPFGLSLISILEKKPNDVADNSLL